MWFFVTSKIILSETFSDLSKWISFKENFQVSVYHDWFIMKNYSRGQLSLVLNTMLVKMCWCLCVVYFGQSLGAGHSQRWWNYAFFMFLALKSLKSKNIETNYCKILLFKFAPKSWLRGENVFFSGKKTLNQHLGANSKHNFFSKFCLNFLDFLWKSVFRPAFRVPSIQTLSKYTTHNHQNIFLPALVNFLG